MKYTHIVCMIVVLSMVSVLAPKAHAVVIKSSVESHAHTGGKTVTDGMNGSDGADGRDGQTVIGSASSAIRIQTFVDGEQVEDIHEIQISEDGTSLRANTASGSIAASVETASQIDAEPARVYGPFVLPPQDSISFASESHDLAALLSTIRITFLSYVTDLF